MKIKEYIKEFILWIKGSADNDPGGASSKKLSAFWGLVILVTPIVFVWLIWAAKHGDWTYLPHMVDATYIFVLGCLGINSYDKFKSKTGGLNEKAEQ